MVDKVLTTQPAWGWEINFDIYCETVDLTEDICRVHWEFWDREKCSKFFCIF